MGSSSTQEIFPLSGQNCRKRSFCYHALKLKCLPLRRGGLSDEDAFFNRDYVPIDILPSDVGGGKNAPPMASLIFGEISNNEMNLTSALYSLSLRSQDNSSNVSELRTMEGFFQERKEFGFLKKSPQVSK